MVSFSKNVLIGLALALISGTFAAPVDLDTLGLQKRVEGGLKLDFEVRTKLIDPSNNLSSISKRGEVADTLINKQYWYATQLELGSNQQVVYVDVDTGSSDLWVVDANAYCQPSLISSDPENCKKLGTYDPSTSTTGQNLGQTFEIEYGDKSTSDGTYYTDSITIAGVTLQNAQFADVTSTSVGQGILGIGRSNLEAAETEYPNLPQVLVSQGYISSNYYSLYLDGPKAATGYVIFGGIDNTKYTGPLIKVPVVSPQRELVTLNSISHANGNNQKAGNAVLLDSGTVITYFFPDFADAFASHFDNLLFNGYYYTGGCNIPDGDATFNFDNGATVKITYSSYLIQNNNGVCAYGFGHRTDIQIFGDNFLRYAYLVYDLDNQEISIAQSNWSAGSS